MIVFDMMTRGLLILTGLSLLPSSALASACKQVRPSWRAEDGAVSMIGEASYLILSPGGIVVVALVVLAARFRKPTFSLVIAAAAAVPAFLNYYVTLNPVGIDVTAREEGCIGDPTLGIAFFAMLAIVPLITQFFLKGGVRDERA
ncbi:MAG: hypothetical protein AAFW47_05595 [Pseudomonadota bacterium]